MVRIAGGIIALLLIFVCVLTLLDKKLSVRMLYVSNGDSFDPAAYGQLHQSLVANLELERQSMDKLTLRQLQKYHSIYLDPSLHEALTKQQLDLLQSYVADGGHLFLENRLAADFPLAFIGAKQLVDIVPPTAMSASSGKKAQEGVPTFTYPEVELNLQSLQQLFRQFMDNYISHDGLADLKQYSWGIGIIPSTAEPIVLLNDSALSALNRYGKGTVMLSSALLPNRYHITGYDMSSGMDPSLGFAKLAESTNSAKKPATGALYFDRRQLPLEPYFDFTYAAGSALFRSEYAAFVSKELLGYSVKKVLGPYGRPAMAHQNHFEAIEAIRDGEGIQWAELLKKYNQLPSFTLVRSSFHWGRWQESVSVHLNIGSNEKPLFHGETPNSFYSSGTRIMSGDKPVQLALYPDYRSLGDPILEPHRAYPALADLNGDGRPELLVGSADGSIYAYPNLGAQPDAYAGQMLPSSVNAPDAFGKREPLRLSDGQPLQSGAYASVAAYDLNGDGWPDLVLGRADGTLAVAYGQAGGTFAAPAALLAGGKPLHAGAPMAPAVGDVTADGVPDLVVGDAAGGVTLYRGHRAAGHGSAAGAGSGSSGGAAAEPLAFDAGSLLFTLPAPFAAPSIRDVNGDGRPDLVVGNSEGDLRVYLQQADGTWQPSGVLEGATTNQLGNRALVGGHNSVPLWYDLNHDGKDDLIVGQLEFGMPTTVDDPKFPYAEQLKTFVQYNKDNYLELFPHIFVHNFTSEQQEKDEIALQQQSFNKLGIPWNMPGTNQHTWRINNPNRTQTLRNEQDAGIWYNFGFKPSNAPDDPRLGLAYNWGMPFLMTDPATGKPSSPPMLLGTPAPVLRLDSTYSTEDLFQSYINFDMPIDYFEHIEYHFPTRVGDLLEFVKYLDQIRNKQSYNFMTEPQMARSFLNTLTTRVTISRPWTDVVLDRLKNIVGIHTEPSIHIKPITDYVPQQAAEYKGTLGLSIERGQAYAQRSLKTDSDISDWRNNKLYLGVPETTQIRFLNEKTAVTDVSANPTLSVPAGAPIDTVLSSSSAEPHMLRSNVPYKLHKNKDSWTLELNANGMQQVQLQSAKPLVIEGEQLQINQQEAEQTYTITHFGAATTITIRF
ncbi:VCBS repeat-containing protein [Paenibacillus sp. LMG 31456]|uniref:VCBS repeat-containing protein n=2 Tax=Paenibacillus foliorum TaxID=2654974 RepID=A0A972GVV3_9BACL|nr:VCBS repeat-containing protein [Paenibacillus foliorum]